MAGTNEVSDVASIVPRIEYLLDKCGNQLNIDLTNEIIAFNQHSGSLFTSNNNKVHVTLGFNDGLTKDASLEQLRSQFNFIALDRLPVPGLDGISPQWQIYPQTPISSFSEGVAFEQYNPATQILKMTVQTGFFAIYGIIPQSPIIADAPSPKGTYLQVRRDIKGTVKLQAKLNFI